MDGYIECDDGVLRDEEAIRADERERVIALAEAAGRVLYEFGGEEVWAFVLGDLEEILMQSDSQTDEPTVRRCFPNARIRPVLEECIEGGVVGGLRRAYKYTDEEGPSKQQEEVIVREIARYIMENIYESFQVND